MEEQRAEDDVVEYDLLSSLPEPLIHHVLSFLPLKEIVKASTVCKSWGLTFSSFPVLDFQSREFAGKASIREGVERMARFVDATMTRFQEQHLKIDKFGIDYQLFRVPKDFVWQSRIEKWTAIALDNNAQEISIVVRHPSFPRWITVTDAPSLDLVALSSPTNLSSLRSLTLDGFEAVEFLSWGRLMSAFGSLESLSLLCCNLEEVRISGLLNLKRVSIYGCRPTRLVEIQAPSLESFSLCDGCSSKRNHPRAVSVNHSPNLRSLTLHNVVGNDGWFRDFLSKFQLLRDLTVHNCHSLSRITISNPLIETINITKCTNLTDISIEAPHFRRLCLLTVGVPLPSIQMKNPPRGKPVAEVYVLFTELGEWSCKIREFLVGSWKSFGSLYLCAHTREYVLELQNDIKYGWLGVIACKPQQLSLAQHHAMEEAVHRAGDGTDASGLIWTPHPPTVTAVAGLSDDDFLQLFCDKVAECRFCPWESGHHCTSYINKADIKIVTRSNNYVWSD